MATEITVGCVRPQACPAGQITLNPQQSSQDSCVPLETLNWDALVRWCSRVQQGVCKVHVRARLLP